MNLTCPNCQSENIKSSRRRGLETISPGQPYRCRECLVRFHVFRTIIGKPFFWVAAAACLVFLLFSYQVVSRMAVRKTASPVRAEKRLKSAAPGPQTLIKWQGGQQALPLQQEAGALAPQLPEKESASRDSALVLQDIIAQGLDTETRIMMQTGSPVSTYECFALNAPKRLVVDLFGKWQVPEKRIFEVKSALVKGVRLGQHPDRLRVVVDLAEKATNVPVLKKISNGLVLTVSGKSSN